MLPGSYQVRSLDHPERTVVIHLEVVEREVLEAYHRRLALLEGQVARLTMENAKLRSGRVA
jgi:hypothetical protein